MYNRILSTLVPSAAPAANRKANAFQRYATAMITVGLALGAALLLRKYRLPHPFTSFSFAAIAISFWYGGTGPGALAILLSYSVLTLFLMPMKVGLPPSESYLIIYGILGLFLGWFSTSRRRAERLLTEARDHLEVCVAERTSQLSRSLNELQTTQSELRTEKNRLKVLLDLTTSLVSPANIRDALGTVIGTVRETTGSDFVGVSLPGSDYQFPALDFVVDGNFPEREWAHRDLPLRIFPVATTPEGRRRDSPDGQIQEDSLLNAQFKTVCVRPLSGRDVASGILVLGRRDDRPYDQSDLDFLGQVANQIGIAVENALAYRQIADLTEQLSQEKLYLEDEIRSESNFEEIYEFVYSKPEEQQLAQVHQQTIEVKDSAVSGD